LAINAATCVHEDMSTNADNRQAKKIPCAAMKNSIPAQVRRRSEIE
jgi:hypothetical protein